MKKVVYFVLLINFLFGYVYHIEKGWNLIGIHSDINVKDLGDYKIIWSFKDGKWAAYSPNENILKLIKSQYKVIDELNATQAIWLYSDKDYTLISNFVDNDYINFKKNWQLVSLSKEGSVDSNLFNNENIVFIWKSELLYFNTW